MADELNIRLDPLTQAGLTVTGRVRQAGGTQVGSDVAMSEGPSGFYSGDFSLAAVGDGVYSVDFVDADGSLVGVGELAVQGNAEVTLQSIYTDTQRVDALIEDSSGDRYTAKALELAAGGATAAEVRVEMDANSTQLAGILTEVDANEAKIDTVISDTAIIKSSITGEALRLQKISAQIGDLQ